MASYNDQHKKSKDKGNQLNAYAKLSGLVFQMAAIIAIGTFCGVKLDEKFPNEHNLYTIVLSFVSVIVSIVFVIRRIIANSKDN
ncbi:AtpZ/AtpI family protein [Meridianimaribacter flavus]|uniref:F0F1-ATPase subunit (Ca2+/Mg2+ transporter) n=1 Tax=Meridianimaribacter flavus TaxID=571115 RepID=A0ABY2G740_9FLAO|nr:AtpZ/AtpI family protein [Meridianimaribacter flavus]TDY13615.1 putative F0F1-ATPase subunit (Ca2+/Mg2+ transporter) [Meridianimaribacter flavus]